MYKPDSYHEDPWVEFIQLDLDDPAEKNGSSDTQHLLGLSRSGSSHVIHFKSDDDSGRASCYDPEIPEDMLTASLLPGHSGRGDQHPLVSRSGSSTPSLTALQTSDGTETPIQPTTPSWANMDFYAQVSDFTPAGEVVLSPGQLNSPPETKKEDDKKTKGEVKIQFQLLSDGAYTSENTARQFDVPSDPGPDQGYQTFPPQVVEGNHGWNDEYLAPVDDSQTPYLLPVAPPASVLPPVSDYTVVQEVDGQNSLLLNPPTPQTSVCTHSPNKQLPAMPNMPMGYLTPDLLGTLTP